MKLATFMDMVLSGRLPLLYRVARLLEPFYRVSFTATAASLGLLRRLGSGPVPLERLAADLALPPDGLEALAAWLKIGVRLGELHWGPKGYTLKGRLSKALAEEKNDPAAAFLEEAASLHYDLIRRLPVRLQEGRFFTLEDQDGELIARSSRIMEPLVFEAIDAVIPASGPSRLLEVGCGSGTYMRYAAARNPDLTALGVELQPEVAEAARRNLREWGLGGRTAVEAGDIRELIPEAAFDVATLHNNIYYFPLEGRVEVLAHVRAFLKPAGRLLLTTGCQGGSVIMELLNLWGAATEGCGRLPTPAEMTAQLREAGFVAVKATRLYPFESYYSFVGINKS